jgi:hypothetical protein
VRDWNVCPGFLPVNHLIHKLTTTRCLALANGKDVIYYIFSLTNLYFFVVSVHKSKVDDNNAWSCNSTPTVTVKVCLIKRRDKLNFYHMVGRICIHTNTGCPGRNVKTSGECFLC